MDMDLISWLAAGSVGLAVSFWAGLLGFWIRSGWESGLAESTSPGGRIQFSNLLDLIPVPRPLLNRIMPVDARLVQHAGLGWPLERFAALRYVILCLLTLCAVLVGHFRHWDLMGSFIALLFVAAGIAGPGLWLRWQVEARRAEIDRALPDFIDRLVLGLEAGLGFEPVLRRTAANFSGLLGQELTVLIRQLDLGHPRSEVLRQLADRNPSARVGAFVAAVRQSDRLGTSLARVLRVQSGLLRSYRRRQAQEAGRRLPILIVFPLVFFLLPALLIVYLAPPLLHLILGS